MQNHHHKELPKLTNQEVDAFFTNLGKDIRMESTKGNAVHIEKGYDNPNHQKIFDQTLQEWLQKLKIN
jgi:hypothetical protein